jgi:hypothetical protein
MADNDSITYDPIYYNTVGFFALLTTVLPALMGQPRFLPILQTIALTSFVAVALHHRNPRGALKVMAVWLPIQFIVLTVLTRFLGAQTEAAFTNGFAYRGAIASWFFAGAPYPDGLISSPLSYLLEFAGIVIGSLATAGLVGVWILVRLVNQAAYGTGILLTSLQTSWHALLVIPYWTLLRIAGYAGMVVLCAEPLLTYNWSPSYYWQNHRKLILVSVALVLLGLIIELFLPGIVARSPLQ